MNMLFTPIKPMLLTMREEIFDSPEYCFQPKVDGIRILAHKQGDKVELYTRHGNIWTTKFPEVVEAVRTLDEDTCILDGEAVVFRGGRQSFDDVMVRARLTNPYKINAGVLTHPVTYVVWDVLQTGIQDHTRLPLRARMEILDQTVGRTATLLPTFTIVGSGTELHEKMKEMDWEGTCAKHVDSPYRLNERHPTDWVKIKLWKTMDTCILAWRQQPRFGILVGARFQSGLKALAWVENGFSDVEKQAFKRIARGITLREEKSIYWIEMGIVARVKYLERTERHTLRLATFERFIFDKKPEECIWVS